MNAKFLLGALLLIASNLTAQSNYYYYKGEKKFLHVEKQLLNINTTDDFQPSLLQPFNITATSLKINKHKNGSGNLLQLEFATELSDINYLANITALKNIEGITHVGKYFKKNSSEAIGTSSLCYVKLKKPSDYTLLDSILKSKGLEKSLKIKSMPLWSRVNVSNITESALEVSVSLYETGLFEEIDPAFMFDYGNSMRDQLNEAPSIEPAIACVNDPGFPFLWGMQNNQNQNIDINACAAWDVTRGANVKIAIVDMGVELVNSDLVSNLAPLSYDTNTGTSPAVWDYAFQGTLDHGTHVAGTLAATGNNDYRVIGVAHESKLLCVSNSMWLSPTFSEELADGITWAWENGADVINNSWSDHGLTLPEGQGLHSAMLENAILDAMILGRDGLGTVMVFCAGNHAPLFGYPANFHDNIIAVGNMTKTGQRYPSSAFGDPLDVVAPGSEILSTVFYDGTQYKWGTSMAAPHVSGIAALLISINPCLSLNQINDIIESTCQKVGNFNYSPRENRENGTWNEEVGYGLVDAAAAVQKAQQMSSQTLDLFVQDTPSDFGLEPNTASEYFWTSQDIWVRNLQDDIVEHQNPEYSATVPNYVYANVTNKSCVPSQGTEKLQLYWAKAGTSLNWPEVWNDQLFFPNNASMGNRIGTIQLPVIAPGETATVSIEWLVPNPGAYEVAEPWHFCMLARIEAGADPMTITETSDLVSNVRNNNNIVWKNISIIDVVPNSANPDEGSIGAMIAIGNPFNEIKKFTLELVSENYENGKPIYVEAEVGIKMDQVLHDAWERGGLQATNMRISSKDNTKIATNNNMLIKDIKFNPMETGKAYLSFNFLMKELTDKSKFTYHVIQRDASTGKIIGGETYVIRKSQRNGFTANAGNDQEFDINSPITITAEQITESAIYNWYDPDGQLIFQGATLTVAPDITKKYRLEVIATSDGFKDYDDIQVTLKPSIITSLSPNPAGNTVTLTYKANAASAYLMIIGSYMGSTTVSNNHILDTSKSEANIDVSTYQSGFYTIALICDGNIVDAKTLFKN